MWYRQEAHPDLKDLGLRMETKIAFSTLFERCPNLRLAVAPEALELQNIPMWHRYKSLPVKLG